LPDLDAVALDLDGTLLESGGRIRDETLGVLRAAAAQGIRILLSTGRPPADIARLADHTGLSALGLPHAAVGNERDLLLRRGGEWVEVQPRNGLRQQAEHALTRALRPAVLGLQEELRALDPDYALWDEAQTAARGFLELHFGNAERAARAACHVRARLLDGHPARPQIMGNRTIFAIRHPDAGKGPNLAELCGLLGLRPRRVLAIGDADNDRSMLDGSWGFLPGAPGNAEPAIADLVRVAGGTVAAGARGAGVAELIAPHLD
jgi:hypothetical protein